MDRWSVSVVTKGKGGFLKSQKDRQLIMNNYLGIGVDGQVALDFHQVHTHSHLRMIHLTITVEDDTFSLESDATIRGGGG